MTEIVRVHHLDITDRVLDNALEVFFGLRSTPRLRKKPSTSELIDWIMALKKSGVDLSRVERYAEQSGEKAPKRRSRR